ncbi:7TM GPCR Srsx domain containing protein [Trichuris trichiura]|uniref:7TM GPCR Srsx domain containing protein n=1 Tax=Trichuris trichiura TaxID=36087 RepID=A0A077YYA9_TRITR|nr:7TM GPCR Srsx domain containing protein [Trichuris trichiura]
MANSHNESDLTSATNVLVSLRPVQYFDVTIGIVISLASATSIVAIFRDTTLRRKNAYILAGVLCFGYFVHSVGIAAKGMFALAYDSMRDGTMQTMQECANEWAVLVTGAEIIIDVSFLIAVDRCLAVFLPMFYRRRKNCWWPAGQLFIVFIHLVSAILRELAYTSDQPIPLCIILTGMDIHAFIGMMIEFNCIVALTIILYVVVIAWARHSIKKAAMYEGNAALQRKRLNWKLIVTMALNMTVYSMTMFIGNVCFTTAAFVETESAVTLLLILGEVDHLSGFFGLCVLFCRMGEFRAAVFRLFNRKVGSIQPSEGYRTDQSSNKTGIA